MKRSHLYKHKFYTFDIETTTIITGLDDNNDPILNGIIWSGQFYDGADYKQCRSLDEIIREINMISMEGRDFENDKICIFVHNLSYEFQFIKDFFYWEQILCTSDRKIISAETDKLVFRCSYFLSNMSLGKFMKNENVPEEYLKSNMDYAKERYPWTPINAEEYKYCANDVIGLHIAIKRRIEDCANKDINNLPMTSTGYVRKDCRKAVTLNKGNRSRFKREALTLEYFKMLHKAFRGGNTGSNRMLTNKILKMLGMKDVCSEYPAVLILFDYPTHFFEMKKFIRREFDYFLENHKKWAMIIEVSWKNIRLKNPKATPIPYISTSKCEKIIFHDGNNKYKEIANGRLLMAAMVKTTITEQDYLTICEQYEWDDEAITRVLYSKKKPIQKELKEQILKYFTDKVTLTQEVDEFDPNFDHDKEYLRKKSKSRLNGIYGMHATLPIKPEYLINNADHSIFVQYEDDEEETEVYAHSVYINPDKTEEELLEEYYNSFSSFLSYQVGVYCTAYARRLLEAGINCCLRTNENGELVSDLVYCDTDSCKYLNPELHEDAFNALNSKIKALAEKRGAFIDYNGKRWYLGIFEDEGIAKRFKTFGAKKYMYSKDKVDKETGEVYEDFEITISGVPKGEGKKRILADIERGKLKDAFDIKKGYVFHDVKMGSTYMDYDDLQEFTTDDGHVVKYASNIAMFPCSYTLGLQADYEMLLESFKEYME